MSRSALRRLVGGPLIFVAGCAADQRVVTSAPPPPVCAASSSTAENELARSDARQEGIDANALQTLLDRSKDTRSDYVIVLRHGKIVAEKDFDVRATPIETMSVTKSIVGLIVGQLVDAGKIASIDVLLSSYFHAWKEDPQKSAITLRDVLTQSSGIADKPTTEDIYASKDFVQLALDAPLTEEPGTTFRYNNKATNLLGAVVERASGMKMDEWARVHLFEPLGIHDYVWIHDPAGNTESMSGLRMRPIDLAKIGQLVLNHGTWNGKSVLSAKWIDAMSTPQFSDHYKSSPNAAGYGMMWWLLNEKGKLTITDATIDKWRSAGVSEDFIAKVSPMKNGVFSRDEFFGELMTIFGGKPGLEAWYDNTWRRGLPDGEMIAGKSLGIRADGWLGNYIVVLPRDELVAVRMRRTPVGPDAAADIADKKFGYFDFANDVGALVKHAN